MKLKSVTKYINIVTKYIKLNSVTKYKNPLRGDVYFRDYPAVAA